MNVRIPSRGDFLVEGKYLFELGGRTKGKSQVKDADNAFVVRDEIEVGFGNVIPLVFARLIKDGWLEYDDLEGVAEEKIERIKSLLRFSKPNTHK